MFETDDTRTACPKDQTREAKHPVAGQELGRFRLLQLIGSGGAGQVYLAYDPKLERQVALKLLHVEGSVTDAARLAREGKSLARLSHPNVVAVYEVEECDGQLLLTMEYVEGETLKDWLVRNPPDGSANRRERALELLSQAGEGLVAAHKAGLVHRDIKPSNILLGTDGRVRVADFGLAQRIEPTPHDDDTTDEVPSHALRNERLTQTGKVAGTPAYMSPEQMEGKKVDERCDQYSFCVTAWEVLFGGRPPARNAPPRVAPDVPQTVVEALVRGLASQPRARHEDMNGLLEVFRSATAGGLTERPGSGVRPRWRRAGLLSALLGLLSVGGGGAVLAARAPDAGASSDRAAVWPDSEPGHSPEELSAAARDVARELELSEPEMNCDEYPCIVFSQQDWLREDLVPFFARMRQRVPGLRDTSGNAAMTAGRAGMVVGTVTIQSQFLEVDGLRLAGRTSELVARQFDSARVPDDLLPRDAWPARIPGEHRPPALPETVRQTAYELNLCEPEIDCAEYPCIVVLPPTWSDEDTFQFAMETDRRLPVGFHHTLGSDGVHVALYFLPMPVVGEDRERLRQRAWNLAGRTRPGGAANATRTR